MKNFQVDIYSHKIKETAECLEKIMYDPRNSHEEADRISDAINLLHDYANVIGRLVADVEIPYL